MLEDYTKVVIQHEDDGSGERYWICPVCGEVNYLCLADEPGMTDNCLICDETVLLMEG